MSTILRIEDVGSEEHLVTVFPHNGGLYKYGWVPGGSLRVWGKSEPFASKGDLRALVRLMREIYGHAVVAEDMRSPAN